MKRFLIDANLPKAISKWGGSEFAFVYDLDPAMSDSRIWEYARENELTIVTKDADFSQRIMLTTPPPKVIHIRVGNMRLHELEAFIDTTWQRVARLSYKHKLVNVLVDRLEGIG